MDPLTEEVYVLHAQILKTLANPRRLMIMDCLHGGEKSVGEIEAAVDLPQANVSQHLAALRAQGLVVPRREGNTVCYALVSETVVKACDLFHDFLLERMRSNRELLEHFPTSRQLLAENNAPV
ncbi:MAG: winged helix-turn-helix transcriptional regulator [Dehalococcoidia bacterium]|nr:winged helix-turn-helix transcriptional regulator [Dehalococcoidia bacterium]